jgi:hypothetical protein
LEGGRQQQNTNRGRYVAGGVLKRDVPKGVCHVMIIHNDVALLVR